MCSTSSASSREWRPRTAAEIPALLRAQRAAIALNGAIWVITAKRTSARPGRPYVPDSALIPMGKASGVVDNKICSVSATDTTMRFVIRRADRGEGA